MAEKVDLKKDLEEHASGGTIEALALRNGVLGKLPDMTSFANRGGVNTTQVSKSGIYIVRTGSATNGYVEDAPFQTTGWHTMVCFVQMNNNIPSGFQIFNGNKKDYIYFRQYTYGNRGGWKKIQFDPETFSFDERAINAEILGGVIALLSAYWQNIYRKEGLTDGSDTEFDGRCAEGSVGRNDVCGTDPNGRCERYAEGRMVQYRGKQGNDQLPECSVPKGTRSADSVADTEPGCNCASVYSDSGNRAECVPEYFLPNEGFGGYNQLEQVDDADTDGRSYLVAVKGRKEVVC